MGITIARNPLVIPAPSGGGGGGGTGGGGGGGGFDPNSAGSNLGEFGAGTFAGYRGPSNTGYQAVYDSVLGRNVQFSDLTPYTGSLTFNGGTYFRQYFKGAPVIIDADTTFNQCYFEAPDGSSGKTGNYMFSGSGKLTLIDCEVNGKGQSGPDAAPYPSGYSYESITHTGMTINFLRCNIYSATDILKQCDNSYLGYSWIHGCEHWYSSAGKPTHSDHTQPATGSCNNWTIEYCTFGTPKSVAATAGSDWTQYETIINGGLMQLGSFNSGATVKNLNVSYCYANDGNYMFAGGVNSAATTCSGLFSHNRCGPHMRYHPPIHGGFTGPAGDGTTLTFDGTNVYDDTFTGYWGTAVTKDEVFG